MLLKPADVSKWIRYIAFGVRDLTPPSQIGAVHFGQRGVDRSRVGETLEFSTMITSLMAKKKKESKIARDRQLINTGKNNAHSSIYLSSRLRAPGNV